MRLHAVIISFLCIVLAPVAASAASFQLQLTLQNGKLPAEWAHCTLVSAVPLSSYGSNLQTVTVDCPDPGDPNAGGQGMDPQQLQKMLEDLAKQGQQATVLDDADKMCVPVEKKCGCNQVERCGFFGCSCQPGANMYKCQCFQQIPNTSHIVIGTCEEQLQCRGRTFTDLKGQTQGVDQKAGNIIGDIFKGILDKVMGGGGAGGGAGSGAGAPTGATGCAQYYQVTTPTTDPCAIYVPPTSSSLLGGSGSNASNQLLQALSGGSTQTVGSAFETGGSGTGASVSSQIVSQLQSAAQGSGSQQNQQSTQSSILLAANLKQATTLPSGTRGDIQITGTGATIFAGSREGNTEVVGFYGADTFGTNQPQGLIARMCQTRPWAGSFVSYVIPPSFFDGLCSLRGYAVGVPNPTPYTTPAYVQQTSSTPPSVAPAPIYSGITPVIDIWATPANVPLGARTSVFWSSQGVASCTVTSSDGNFSENTLSGGAATVPITGSTTFTATCLAPDGTSVTDSFTVNLSI